MKTTFWRASLGLTVAVAVVLAAPALGEQRSERRTCDGIDGARYVYRGATRIFWKWQRGEDGRRVKEYFTCWTPNRRITRYSGRTTAYGRLSIHPPGDRGSLSNGRYALGFSFDQVRGAYRYFAVVIDASTGTRRAFRADGGYGIGPGILSPSGVVAWQEDSLPSKTTDVVSTIKIADGRNPDGVSHVLEDRIDRGSFGWNTDRNSRILYWLRDGGAKSAPLNRKSLPR